MDWVRLSEQEGRGSALVNDVTKIRILKMWGIS